MRVKLLLLVVEGMTSLSRIIRSNNAEQEENKTVEIQIRNIFSHEFDLENLEEQLEPHISIEEIFAERDQILQEAKREIEAEREEFEQYRNEQLNTIEQLKQLWEEEKLVLEQKAYEQGFQQGYEEGIQKANTDMSEALKQANQTIENSHENARKYIEDQEQVILDLALTTAERIIGTSLENNNEIFVSIVKRGLKEAREMKEIKVYVSPKYYSLVTDNRDELAELFPKNVPFLIFVNDDLNDLESYIETNHGRIVISIDEQLNELRSKLNEILESKE